MSVQEEEEEQVRQIEKRPHPVLGLHKVREKLRQEKWRYQEKHAIICRF